MDSAGKIERKCFLHAQLQDYDNEMHYLSIVNLLPYFTQFNNQDLSFIQLQDTFAFKMLLVFFFLHCSQ